MHRLVCQQQQNRCPDVTSLRASPAATTRPTAARPAATTSTLVTSVTVWTVLLTSRADPTTRLGIPATSRAVFKFPNGASILVTH
ncbi:MAG TPA: hypothetical protein VJW23_07250 [Propionibacteriaceae bacterium]|nr:hypothetical protein [Propionibacteriaceae bacterium]